MDLPAKFRQFLGITTPPLSRSAGWCFSAARSLFSVTGICAIIPQISDVERDFRQIRRDLYELGEKVENNLEYRKEIAHALERIAAIERHLGIERKITA